MNRPELSPRHGGRAGRNRQGRRSPGVRISKNALVSKCNTPLAPNGLEPDDTDISTNGESPHELRRLMAIIEESTKSGQVGIATTV